MRKLLLVLLAVIFAAPIVPVLAYEDGGTTHIKEKSGGQASTPVRVYQLIRNPINTANDDGLSAGDVVVWDTLSDDGVTVNLAGFSGTASVDAAAVAGVVVTTIQSSDNSSTTSAEDDVDRRNWGYIQTYGLNTSVRLSVVEGPIQAGMGLRAASGTSGDGRACRIQGNDYNYARLGFAYDAATSSTSASEVFVQTR